MDNKEIIIEFTARFRYYVSNFSLLGLILIMKLTIEWPRFQRYTGVRKHQDHWKSPSSAVELFPKRKVTIRKYKLLNYYKRHYHHVGMLMDIDWIRLLHVSCGGGPPQTTWKEISVFPVDCTISKFLLDFQKRIQ